MNKLTPEQISLLTDAELNAACAERVMGLEGFPHDWDCPSGDAGYQYCKNCEASTSNYELNGSPCCIVPPPYATSLADAAKCTEKMLAKGLCLEMHSCAGKEWICELFAPEDGKALAISKCATEPRARAEASLLAAGEEGK